MAKDDGSVEAVVSVKDGDKPTTGDSGLQKQGEGLDALPKKTETGGDCLDESMAFLDTDPLSTLDEVSLLSFPSGSFSDSSDDDSTDYDDDGEENSPSPSVVMTSLHKLLAVFNAPKPNKVHGATLGGTAATATLKESMHNNNLGGGTRRPNDMWSAASHLRSVPPSSFDGDDGSNSSYENSYWGEDIYVYSDHEEEEKPKPPVVIKKKKDRKKEKVKDTTMNPKTKEQKESDDQSDDDASTESSIAFEDSSLLSYPPDDFSNSFEWSESSDHSVVVEDERSLSSLLADIHKQLEALALDTGDSQDMESTDTSVDRGAHEAGGTDVNMKAKKKHGGFRALLGGGKSKPPPNPDTPINKGASEGDEAPSSDILEASVPDEPSSKGAKKKKGFFSKLIPGRKHKSSQQHEPIKPEEHPYKSIGVDLDPGNEPDEVSEELEIESPKRPSISKKKKLQTEDETPMDSVPDVQGLAAATPVVDSGSADSDNHAAEDQPATIVDPGSGPPRSPKKKKNRSKSDDPTKPKKTSKKHPPKEATSTADGEEGDAPKSPKKMKKKKASSSSSGTKKIKKKKDKASSEMSATDNSEDFAKLPSEEKQTGVSDDAVSSERAAEGDVEE